MGANSLCGYELSRVWLNRFLPPLTTYRFSRALDLLHKDSGTHALKGRYLQVACPFLLSTVPFKRERAESGFIFTTLPGNTTIVISSVA